MFRIFFKDYLKFFLVESKPILGFSTALYLALFFLAPLSLINLTPPAAVVVFFTIGVCVTAAGYAVLLLIGFWVFTQPPPPPPP